MSPKRLLPLIALLAFQGADRAQGAASSITVAPASLSFQYQISGAVPPSQTLALKSTGAAVAFTVTVLQPAPCSAPCLTVSASSGTTPASLSVYANPTGLAAGTYPASITITATAAGAASQTINVTLSVSDAPASLSVNVTSLDFSYTTGNVPIVQTTQVAVSTDGDALTASVAVSGSTWLKASPTGSIALIGLPQTLTVTVDATGLTPSATPYKGTVTVSSTNALNKSVAITVTLTVTAGVPTIVSTWPPGAPAGSTNPVTVTITGTNFTPASTAVSGMTALTTPLTSITVVNSTTMLATIPASLLATAGHLPIEIVTPTAATASAPWNFAVYDPTVPQVWAVVNSASYNPAIISPGEIITIYGAGLGPAGITQFSGSPLPTSLGVGGANTSVMIAGEPAPLLYTSPTQLSCIVPEAIAQKSAGTVVDLFVSYNGVTSTIPGKAGIATADPGIFTLGPSGQGAVLNIDTSVTPNNYSVNGVKNAAPAGSWVAIYATGFGTTNCTAVPNSPCDPQPPAEGQLVTGGTVMPAGAVAVTIGGQPVTAPVGVVPVGSVIGLLQINAQLPVSLPSGPAVPVVISIGGIKSLGTATIAIK
ncbi:exported hypothetical protein [Candidatus Sulfopaludibacter sp. SbA3]|nr:exported hypothetical protein [Candidatus Sulfopaludibacter sp. SbA3]